MKHPVKKVLELGKPNPLINVSNIQSQKLRGKKIHWWAIDRYQFHSFKSPYIMNKILRLCKNYVHKILAL